MATVVRLCFLLSGASGLIFELLWTRMLTLVFGSTTLAISTVLTAFMGGLGLGSYLAGRLADRLRDPVRTYAIIEAFIGLYALFVPWIVGHYEPLNHWLWSAFGDRYGLLSLLRFGASAALLILPTTLMGATLPLLARFFVTGAGDLANVGRRLGTLYALNLFGAVAGTFVAGFVLLPALGVQGTNLTAASFNFSLAAAALAAGRLARRPRGPTLDELLVTAARAGNNDAAQALPPPPLVTPAARRMVIAAFAISGGTAMTLQVLWTRALAVVIGSSIYSFTLILIAVLVGLGVGSALFGKIADGTARPVTALGVVNLGIVAALGLSYLVTDDLPFVFAWLVASTRFGTGAILACQFALACLAILPATLLSGAVFPFTMRVAARSVDHLGRDVGRTYAVNTVGAIVGSFASGFFVLPGLGLQKGVFLCALVLLGVSAALFLVSPGLAASRRWAGVGAAVAMGIVASVFPRWNLTSLSTGFFRIAHARDYIERTSAKKTWQTPELVYYADGVATTVSVDRWGNTFSMKNNGKVDASSDADMPTQISVGLLPMLLSPKDDARVALIGYGSGVTAGSVTQAAFSSLEIVELEPAIYEASHFFDHVNHRPLESPKVTARVGDGRNFLGQRDDRFDVIISQPSNPWITGVSNLFTREYFQAIKRRLAPGGIFCQWAQLYEMAPWNVKAIYRTLHEEFPHVTIFAAEDLSSDTIAIATLQPLPLDLARVARRLADPRTRAEAARAGWQSPFDLAAQVLLAPHEIGAFVAGAALNTDDNALIEFAAPRDLLGFARFDPYLAKVYGPEWPYGRLLGLLHGLDTPGTPAAHGHLSRSLLAHGKVREAEHWARLGEARASDGPLVHARLLLDLVSTRLDRDPEIALAPRGDLAGPPKAPARDAGHIAREYGEVAALVQARRFVTAYKVIEAWPEALWDDLWTEPVSEASRDFALLAGFLHYKAEFFSDAVGLLEPLENDEAYVRRRPEALYYLGRARFASALHGKGVVTLERFAKLQAALGRPVLPSSRADVPGLPSGAPP
jgi:spermidine synthase